MRRSPPGQLSAPEFDARVDPRARGPVGVHHTTVADGPFIAARAAMNQISA